MRGGSANAMPPLQRRGSQLTPSFAQYLSMPSVAQKKYISSPMPPASSDAASLPAPACRTSAATQKKPGHSRPSTDRCETTRTPDGGFDGSLPIRTPAAWRRASRSATVRAISAQEPFVGREKLGVHTGRVHSPAGKRRAHSLHEPCVAADEERPILG